MATDVNLPRECCEAMREQFNEAGGETNTWHDGFWVFDGRVIVGADGEWQCKTPLLFCPFCGKRYEFGEEKWAAMYDIPDAGIKAGDQMVQLPNGKWAKRE